MIGTTLGHYRVTAELGRGGMGEVWRAEDGKLGREVALKLLPAGFADDPDRHARFEREARLLASLNHPNIATLYGLEHVDVPRAEPPTAADTPSTEPIDPSDQLLAAYGMDVPAGEAADRKVHVLVMELVEGEGLDERIARGPIPASEAIPIALQIAEALEAAHEQGIVHRDLKPANIKLTPDGTVKVLDFGLAKAWQVEDGDDSLSMSPTMTTHGTVEGVILGTAAYMSPEQARGQAVDRRADVWAFGVVLWEMLTGRKLFDGDTVSDVLAAVLKETPDVDAIPPDCPSWLRRLIARCLDRDPKRRLQWIGDARVELEVGGDESTTPASADDSKSSRAVLTTAVVATVAAIAAVAAVAWALSRPPTNIGDPLHVDLSNAAFKAFSNSAISPNGRWVAYLVGEDLELRSLDSFDVQTLPDTDDAENPFFSPDGRWVAYFTSISDGVSKVSVDGGTPLRIPGVFVSGSFNTGTWHPDGQMILSSAVIDGRAWRGLAVAPATGGEATILTTPEPHEIIHHEPSVVPDTDWVLFTIERPGDWAIGAVSLSTGEQKIVVTDAATPTVLDGGRLLAFRYGQSNLSMYPFDVDRAEIVGEPTVVLPDVGNGPREGGNYAVSRNGTLIYSPLDDNSLLAGGRSVVWVGRDGTVEQTVEKGSSWSQPRISPDGRRLLLRRVATPDCDLWTYDLGRGTLTRITVEDDAHDPLWHHTGESVLYAGDLEPTRVVFEVPADGTGSPVVLAKSEKSLRPASWSGDGRRLALTASGPTLKDDVWVLDTDRDPEPQPFLDSRFGERFPAFSPNGRWLAYASDQSGRWEVYVRPYPGPGGRIQVSIDGGSEPLWSGDGRELFYRTAEQMMVVSVSDGDGLVIGRPQKLFDDPHLRPSRISADVHSYDVAPDGSRFLMITNEEREVGSADLRVVIGWADSLSSE